MLVTVILPIYNESKYIKATLNAIIDQDYKFDEIEIIISDGMSTDGTREIIKYFINLYPNIILIDNPEKIVPTGFNRGLSIAKGDVIVRVDGHTIIDKTYISRCVKLLKDRKFDNVGGKMSVVWNNIFDGVVAIATSSRFGIGNAAFHYSNEGRLVDTVYLGAWRKTIFKKIGGFDQELVRNQDDEFNLRITQSGGKIWLDPKIKSKYYARNSLIKLFKQYFQYGFYKIRVNQKRKGFSSWRQFVPACFVFVIFASIILSIISLVPLVFTLGVYFFVNITVSISNIIKMTFFQNLKNHKAINKLSFLVKSIFYLPTTYFTLHFSYGLGFLSGIIFFMKRWGDTRLKDDYFIR